MKKRVFTFIVLVCLLLNSFILPVNSEVTEESLSSEFSYRGIFYYDADNPYNYVYGNSDYAYKCYAHVTNALIFFKDGVLVTDRTTNIDLIKMHFSQHHNEYTLFLTNKNLATKLIELVNASKFNDFIDNMISAASESLGSILAVYLSGGTVSTSLILRKIATQTVDDLMSNFTDISTIISDAQLNLIYYNARILDTLIEELNSITDFTVFENCEKFAKKADELEKLSHASVKLIPAITDNTTTNVLEILGGCLVDAGKGFVGEFGEFISDSVKITELKNYNPGLIAKAITIAKKLGENPGILSLETISEMSEMYDNALSDIFYLVEACQAYRNTATTMDLGISFNNSVLNSYFNIDDPKITPDGKEYLATEFSATVPDGVYTIKNADSGLMINVYDGKNADGTNVVTWKFDGTTDQRFYVKHIKNGKYALYALCSANGSGEYTRCIDVYTGDTDILPANGNNVDIYTRSTTWDNCQLFYIVPFEDGTYAFESCAVPKLVIGATNPNKNNGNICMETWNIDSSQRWELCNTGGMTEYDAFENDYVNIGERGEDIIGVAYTQLGYIELDVTTEAPLYNGEGTWYTKYGQRFNDSTGAWCSYFVMWCAEQAGIPTSVIPQARVYGNCGAFVNWFKANGKWKSAEYTPFPGDIVFFDGDKDGYANHVGIVTGVNEDGSIATIEGNSLSGGGYYQVREDTHSEDILGYGAPGFDYSDYTNAWITEGGKTKGTAYMLPDTSSETVWYVDTNDECVILCFDRYADYYLLMYPFLNTGKYVVAYVPGKIVSRFADPYPYVPDAEEYYDINKQVVLSKDTVSYHNPSTASLMNGSVDVKVRTEWTEGTIVTVLFEYCGYYFVTTETESGFVPTDKIDLNNAPKPSIPDTEDPIPDQPDVEYPVGDVDGDGVVTEQDGQLVLQFAAKMIELDESQLQRADADENGVVNVADASKIFVMIKNMEET